MSHNELQAFLLLYADGLKKQKTKLSICEKWRTFPVTSKVLAKNVFKKSWRWLKSNLSYKNLRTVAISTTVLFLCFNGHYKNKWTSPRSLSFTLFVESKSVSEKRPYRPVNFKILLNRGSFFLITILSNHLKKTPENWKFLSKVVVILISVWYNIYYTLFYGGNHFWTENKQ